MRTLITWVCAITLAFVLWSLTSWLHDAPDTLPPPLSAIRLLASDPTLFMLLAGRTGFLALGGLFLSAIIAAALILFIGFFPETEPFFYPMVVMVKASPAVAFAPLLGVIFHSGPSVKVIVAAMISFFPMLVGGLDGMRRTPDSLQTTATVYGAGRVKRFWVFCLGYAFSGYLTGAKTAAPLAVVGAIVGEFVDATAAGSGGIGVYIATHSRSQFMDHVCAGVIVSTCLGLILFGIISAVAAAVERRLHLDI